MKFLLTPNRTTLLRTIAENPEGAVHEGAANWMTTCKMIQKREAGGLEVTPFGAKVYEHVQAGDYTLDVDVDAGTVTVVPRKPKVEKAPKPPKLTVAPALPEKVPAPVAVKKAAVKKAPVKAKAAKGGSMTDAEVNEILAGEAKPKAPLTDQERLTLLSRPPSRPVSGVRIA